MAAQSTYSLSFDGSGDYLSIPLAPPSGYMAVSVWVKPNADGIVLGWNDQADGNFPVRDRIIIIAADGSVQWYAFNGSVNRIGTTGVDVLDGNWHHICVTIRPSFGMQIYVDGLLAIVTSLDGSPSTVAGGYTGYGTPHLVIGRSTFQGDDYDGLIDDVAVFDAAPDESDIEGIADGSVNVNTLDPYGLWRLEEGTGTDAADTSGNSNDGTITGATWDSDVPGPLQDAGGGGTIEEDYSGSCTPSGALVKSVAKALAGSETASGALAKSATKALAGSSASAGVLAKLAAKGCVGSSTGSGSCAKQAQKPLAGSSTSSGVLNTLKVALLAVSGAVTAAGSLAKSVLKSCVGSSSGSGTCAKQAQKSLAGASTASGTASKQTSKSLAGSSSPSGTLDTLKVALLAVAGAVSATGSFIKSVFKSLAGSVASSGTLTTDGGAEVTSPKRVVFTLPICRRKTLTLPICRRQEF